MTAKTRPSSLQLVRQRVAGAESGSLGAWARGRRWDMLLRTVPDLASLRVLDLGGTPEFWAAAPVQPAHLTVMNLEAPSEHHRANVEVIVGDACEAVSLIAEGTIDFVFSNSTIEHVGGHHRCLEFARSVHTIAPRHWIQTPYRYFPVEPHFVFPAFQFLPMELRRRIIASWPLSHARAHGGVIDDPVGVVASTELLGRTQLRYYFPESTILSERILGMTKSIIAVA